MHPKYHALTDDIEVKLRNFSSTVRPLPGISSDAAVRSLAMQMIDSRRKIDRTVSLQNKNLSAERSLPGSPLFDPEMAALISLRSGDLDNACWLAFLSVHFGRHLIDGWDLIARIYGKGGPSPELTWSAFISDPTDFSDWLRNAIATRNSPLGRFGNHRKYESLDPNSTNGTPAILRSYATWVQNYGTHADLFVAAQQQQPGTPRSAFAWLYQRMKAVKRFGRLGKFDFLTTLGKLGIAPIEADQTYMAEATGPLKGARLLFAGSTTASTSASHLEDLVSELDQSLLIGMQAMEDSLCNWQKSPTKFTAFRG